MMKNSIICRHIYVMLITIAFTLLSAHKCAAQDIAPQNMEKLHIMEDSLIVSADSMFGALIPDSRLVLSERFARQLVRALKIPGSWSYPFDTLSKMVNIIYPDDKSFRVFNWEISPSTVAKRYYGAIQLPQEKLKLYGLLDYTDQLGKGAEDSILTGGKWFGALYYRILTGEFQGRKVYTMFGVNSSSPLTERKVLDPMIIDEKGVRFGLPMFGVASQNFPRQRINRFILEYKKGVHVSMNWDTEKNMIVFDKLASLSNDPGRRYTFAPTGQYDGFYWNNDTWNYKQDLIPITILKDGDAPSDPPK
jgi:hypothetical protein